MKPLDIQKNDKPAVSEAMAQLGEVLGAALEGMPAAEAEPIDFSKVEIEPLFADFVDFEPSPDPTSAPSRSRPARP